MKSSHLHFQHDDHPVAVGSDVRVGRVGLKTDILWIAVCYQGFDGSEQVQV